MTDQFFVVRKRAPSQINGLELATLSQAERHWLAGVPMEKSMGAPASPACNTQIMKQTHALSNLDVYKHSELRHAKTHAK